MSKTSVSFTGPLLCLCSVNCVIWEMATLQQRTGGWELAILT